MEKYRNCPEGYDIVEEHHLYIILQKEPPPSKPVGGVYTLRLPAQYWPRFIYDIDFRESLFNIYAKLIYTDTHPKKDFIFNGRVVNDKPDPYESKSGVVPEDLKHVFTKFPDCPSGYSKHSENDKEIKLGFYYLDLSDGGHLTVPTILWDRFVTDKKWRSEMLLKYARLNELDYKSPEEIIKRYGEKELYKTGVIPESEY